MTRPEDRLLFVADSYEAAASGGRGRLLARVATVVANRGSFFEPIRRGSTCSVRNFALFVRFFSDRSNWPDNIIPPPVEETLAILAAAFCESEKRAA